MEDETPFGPDPLRRMPAARPTEYLCTLPADLGAVTRLRKVNGRMVAETESGILMIVPHKAALV